MNVEAWHEIKQYTLGPSLIAWGDGIFYLWLWTGYPNKCGVVIRNVEKHPLMFSERYGHTKTWRFGKIVVSFR